MVCAQSAVLAGAIKIFSMRSTAVSGNGGSSVQICGRVSSRMPFSSSVSLQQTKECVENDQLVRRDLVFICREQIVSCSDLLVYLDGIPAEPHEVVLIFENRCCERTAKPKNDDVVRWFDQLLAQVRKCAQAKGFVVENSFLNPFLGRFRAEFNLAWSSVAT